MLRFAFYLVLLLAVNTAHGADYDCSVGCSLDPNFMGSQVCGDNGVTYLNECLAYCQNIVIASFGPCNGDSARFDAAEEWDIEAFVSVEEMQRFSGDSFTFVGKKDPSQFSDTVPDEPTFDRNSARREQAQDGPLRLVRMTSEGLQYSATVSDKTYPPSAPKLPSDSNRRNLSILGADTRSRVYNTQSFPYSAISSINYGGSGGCTGTVISRTGVLTAGHCVWDGKKYIDQKSTITVVPGRDASSSPFGVWDVDYVTAFDTYVDRESRFYDVGVIEVKPKTGSGGCNQYIGDVVGIVGVDAPVPYDSRLRESTVTGFGSDKNGQMWTSGRCDGDWDRQTSGEAAFGIHYCDTVGGNSGSSAITTSNVALAVHGYGNVGNGNGGPLLEKGFYTAVYEMAGIATEASLPNSCLEPGNSNGGSGTTGGDGTGTGTDGTDTDNDGTGTGTDGTDTGNDGTVTGNDGTDTGNDGTVTGNDGTGTGNDGTGAGNDGTGTGNDGIGTGINGTGIGTGPIGPLFRTCPCDKISRPFFKLVCNIIFNAACRAAHDDGTDP